MGSKKLINKVNIYIYLLKIQCYQPGKCRPILLDLPQKHVSHASFPGRPVNRHFRCCVKSGKEIGTAHFHLALAVFVSNMYQTLQVVWRLLDASIYLPV